MLVLSSLGITFIFSQTEIGAQISRYIVHSPIVWGVVVQQRKTNDLKANSVSKRVWAYRRVAALSDRWGEWENLPKESVPELGPEGTYQPKQEPNL